LNELVARCFAEPLADLGERDPALRGILAPLAREAAATRGVTSQFIEHAADYASRYGNVAYFRMMLDDALARLDPPLAPRVILDIGSGAGNSVLPLLDRYADAFVVATDISAPLLAILRDHLAREPRYAGRYALVCIDDCAARYRPESFDLAVGAAILHHVLEPERVLDACGEALRPGGAAIFFEPFELGHAVLHLAYREILAEAARRDERTPGIAMVQRLQQDYAARSTNRDDPRLVELDDKWMFTAEFFEAAARRGRWSSCLIHPTHEAAAPLRETTRVNLRLGMDADESVLPDWAWERLAACEGAFSEQARRALPFECAVVMRTRFSTRPAKARASWWFDAAAPGRGFFVATANGVGRVVACHYDDAGQPVWHAAGPAPLVDGVLRASARRMSLRGTHGGDGGELVLRLTAIDAVALEWSDEAIALAPQHPGSPGWSGEDPTGIGGAWIEEAATPSVMLVVEDLGERVFAAALLPDSWCAVVATRRGREEFAGEWLRFEGGQALRGTYRAPRPPLVLGAARLMRVATDRLVVQLAGGGHHVLRRALDAFDP